MSGRAARMPLLLSVSPPAPPPSLCFSLHISLHIPLPLLPSLSNTLPTGSLSCSSPHSSPLCLRTLRLLRHLSALLAPRTTPSPSLFLFPLASSRSTRRSVVASLPLTLSATLTLAASGLSLSPSTPPLPSPASSLCFSSRIAPRCIPLTRSILLPSPHISSLCRTWFYYSLLTSSSFSSHQS